MDTLIITHFYIEYFFFYFGKALDIDPEMKILVISKFRSYNLMTYSVNSVMDSPHSKSLMCIDFILY